MTICKNCGCRLSHNLDGAGGIAIGYHHKRGHGAPKYQTINGEKKEKGYSPCPCRKPEPKEESQ